MSEDLEEEEEGTARVVMSEDREEDIEDVAYYAPDLWANRSLLSDAQLELGKMLVEMEQSHLFSGWPNSKIGESLKHGFFDKVDSLNSRYPGGLKAYIGTVRKLLADKSRAATVQTGGPSYGIDAHRSFEEAGDEAAWSTAYVLVFGEFGERLGYNRDEGSPSRDSKCDLQAVIQRILTFRGSADKGDISFAILTENDTHTEVENDLKVNSYFGMKDTQIRLVKQEEFACWEDNDAKLLLDPRNKFSIQTRSHGRGDVHPLLYSSGLVDKWQTDGVKWILFFGHTNERLFEELSASGGDIFIVEVTPYLKELEETGGLKEFVFPRHVDHTKLEVNKFQTLYTDIVQLGNGGFGVGFLCRHLLDGRTYVVKAVPCKETGVEQALSECKVMAKLNHDNVVRYYDAWIERGIPPVLGDFVKNLLIEDGVFRKGVVRKGADDKYGSYKLVVYLALEACPRDLSKEINDIRDGRVEKFTVYEVETIFIGALKALAHIHSKGLIHGDIHPGNIFLDETRRHPKLGDFGLSGYNKKRFTRSFGGKADYLLEDVVLGKELYTAADDLFALALCMVELLCPFGSEMEKCRAFEGMKKDHLVISDLQLDDRIYVCLRQIIEADTPRARGSAAGFLRWPFGCI